MALYTITLTRDGSWCDSGAAAKYDTECAYISGVTYPTIKRLFVRADPFFVTVFCNVSAPFVSVLVSVFVCGLASFDSPFASAPSSTLSSSVSEFESSSVSESTSPKLRMDSDLTTFAPRSPARQSLSRSRLGGNGPPF